MPAGSRALLALETHLGLWGRLGAPATAQNVQGLAVASLFPAGVAAGLWVSLAYPTPISQAQGRVSGCCHTPSPLRSRVDMALRPSLLMERQLPYVALPVQAGELIPST